MVKSKSKRNILDDREDAETKKKPRKRTSVKKKKVSESGSAKSKEVHISARKKSKMSKPRNALEQDVSDTIEHRIIKMGKARKDPVQFSQMLSDILTEYRKMSTKCVYVPGMDPSEAKPSYPYPWIRPLYTDSAEVGEILLILFSDALMIKKESTILARFAGYKR